jgi:hypothetical protein
MRARKYNKRLEIWQTSPVSDGFGGSTLQPTLITYSWCKLVTLDRNSRSTDFGITDTTDTIILQLRKRNDLAYNSKNQFFKYRGLKYIIQGTPINVGFEDREIQITLKQESLKEVNDITPIGGVEFPYTFNFQLA